VQLLGSKRLNPALVSQYAHLDNGVDEFLDELKSKVSPEGKITMSPESIGRLANLVDYVTKEEVKAQNLVNNHYIEQANKYGVDPKDLLVPQTTDRGPVTLQKIEKWTAEARAARIPESDIAARMAKIKVQNGIR
jgi:hypothetical protein